VKRRETATPVLILIALALSFGACCCPVIPERHLRHEQRNLNLKQKLDTSEADGGR
jgi:hypothetical protein